jgi:hypothetical protein
LVQKRTKRSDGTKTASVNTFFLPTRCPDGTWREIAKFHRPNIPMRNPAT